MKCPLCKSSKRYTTFKDNESSIIINVYYHLLKYNNNQKSKLIKKLTPDEYIFKRAEEKYKIINQMLLLMRETSINCETHDKNVKCYSRLLNSNNYITDIYNPSLDKDYLQNIKTDVDLIKYRNSNTIYFRDEIQRIGYQIKDGVHPIVPIMLGDAKLAQDIARDMLNDNIYVVGFSYPVVPKGEARIRVQISASHSMDDIDCIVSAFKKVGEKYNIIKK